MLHLAIEHNKFLMHYQIHAIKPLKPIFNGENVKLSNNRFVKRLATVSGGALLGQLFLVASTPLLTRLYGVEIFGTYIILSSIANLIGSSAAGRYELALSLADDEDVHHLLRLCIVLPLMMSLILMFPAIAFGGAISSAFGIEAYQELLWTAPVILFFSVIPLSFDFYNLRYDMPIRGGIGRTIQYSLQAIVQVAGGYLGFGLYALIAGIVFSTLARLLFFIFSISSEARWQLARLSWSRTVCVARKFWRFPALNASAALLANFSQNATPLLLSYVGGAALAGIYGGAMRILNAPIRLLGNAATRVFVTELRTAKSSSAIFLSSGTILGATGALLYVPIVIAGPVLFTLLLGHGWGESGEYARAMAPFLWIRLLLTPLGNASNLFNGQKENFLFGLVSGVLPLGVCGALLAAHYGGLTAIWFYSISSAVLGTIQLIWIYRRLVAHDRSKGV